MTHLTGLNNERQIQNKEQYQKYERPEDCIKDYCTYQDDKLWKREQEFQLIFSV